MSDPTDTDHVYMLPAPVVVAMSAGRPEMLTPFVQDIADGKLKLTKEAQAELLSLVKGLLGDVVEYKAKCEKLTDVLEAVLGQARVAADAAKFIIKSTENL